MSWLIVARLESSRITQRAVTDLPEPLSPTMATVSPRCTWKLMSRTASTVPPSTLKVTPRLRASSMHLAAAAPRSRRSSPATRVWTFMPCPPAPQYGSIASRSPSPSALNAKTVSSTKPTGERIQG